VEGKRKEERGKKKEDGRKRKKSGKNPAANPFGLRPGPACRRF
jgi:hypothetical protein